MTENECNCSTCTNPSCWHSLKWDGKINRKQETVSLWEMDVTRKNFTRAYGCLSHPRAREVLMATMITELERCQHKEGACDHTAWKCYGKAITLIKEGVGK